MNELKNIQIQIAKWSPNAPSDLVSCGYNSSAVFNTNVNKHVEIAGGG